jgi:transcriptional regulator GlxA family with amidase domain
LDRHFREINGISVTRWLLRQCIIRARRLLEDTGLPVGDIAQAAGVTTAATPRPYFRRAVGVASRRYREALRISATRKQSQRRAFGGEWRGLTPDEHAVPLRRR